ncbi:MAG: hypothetical protein KIT58_04135 [Planctomycetota bacterium]|nr:hypothetical protein [Planctomycetota bacterium]
MRLSRRWVRLGLGTALVGGLALLSASALLETDAPTSRPPVTRVAAPAPAPPTAEVDPTPTVTGATATRRVREAPPRPAPRTVGDVLRQDASLDHADLAAWVVDRALASEVRYGALRRLEQDDPSEAVTAALRVLDDVTPLVRLNAIAVLTRSQDPRAAAALERLDDRSRRLATALARR